MANKDQKPFRAQLSFHAFNGDKSMVALSENGSEVQIFKTNGKPSDTASWGKEPEFRLTEHTGYISGIDWHPKTNLIVTAGHDRNAYVWKFEGGEWKPTLVILRINRAATDVKWSPDGQKFAVASGAKCVPVCHFEESNNWWISKMIKKHKSTVTSVAWSPNGKFLLTGACDFKARVCSAFIEGLDSADDDGFGSTWPKQHEFGEVLQEFDSTKAWVNDTAWSPNGQVLCWVGHGSTIHFSGPGGEPQTIYSKSLPFLHVFFLDDNTVVACGWDNNPHVYKNKGGSWEFEKKLDEEKAGAAAGGAAPKKAFGSAFAKFQQADSQGAKFGTKAGSANAIKTFHQNTVTSFHNFGDGKTFTCASLDGRLLTWAA